MLFVNRAFTRSFLVYEMSARKSKDNVHIFFGNSLLMTDFWCLNIWRPCSVPSKLCAHTQLPETAHTNKLTAHRLLRAWVFVLDLFFSHHLEIYEQNEWCEDLSFVSSIDLCTVDHTSCTQQNFCAHTLQEIRGNIVSLIILSRIKSRQKRKYQQFVIKRQKQKNADSSNLWLEEKKRKKYGIVLRFSKPTSCKLGDFPLTRAWQLQRRDVGRQ